MTVFWIGNPPTHYDRKLNTNTISKPHTMTVIFAADTGILDTKKCLAN